VTDRLKSLPTGAQAGIVAGGLLLVLLVGYLALISPKHSQAASLKKQTASVQAEIDSNKSTSFTQALPAVRSANVFSLTQAMPNKLDTAGVLIQLSQLAQDSGISFDQIQPTGATSTASTTTTTTVDPFAANPINVQFTGSFYNLLTFLQRVRNLVRVENGKLYTSGRLLDVSSVTFSEGVKGWPQVQATLVINEFVPNTAPATPTTPGTTDTTSTTTTPATTTPDSTAAAPSTNGGTS
jgi:Tfp pilus assembly protein PilO